MKKINNTLKDKPLIIAEIGNNHEGSFSVAKKLILEASKAGVDAVKFQTFKTENFINDLDKKRFKRFKKFELSRDQFIKLAKLAKQKRLKFISTPLDIESASFLNSIVDYFKISSGDNNFYYLIEKVLSFKKPTIISTGLLNYAEIKNLLKFIKKIKFPIEKLTLLHCVSSYPVLDNEANLKSVYFLKKKLKISIGYSDHTIGIEAAIVAVAYGATIIEKHFTINKNYSDFRDHKLSADPEEMTKLVASIKKTSLMLGDHNKKIGRSEKLNLSSMRRSIYIKRDLKKGQKILFNDLKIVRPSNELKNFDLKKVVKKILKKDLKKSEPLLKKNIKN